MQNGSFLNTYLFLIKPFLLTKFDCITKSTLNGGIRLLSFNFLPTISWQKKLNESNNLPLAFGSWSSTQVFQFIVQTSPESRISNLSRKIKCWHCYSFLSLDFFTAGAGILIWQRALIWPETWFDEFFCNCVSTELRFCVYICREKIRNNSKYLSLNLLRKTMDIS